MKKRIHSTLPLLNALPKPEPVSITTPDLPLSSLPAGSFTSPVMIEHFDDSTDRTIAEVRREMRESGEPHDPRPFSVQLREAYPPELAEEPVSFMAKIESDLKAIQEACSPAPNPDGPIWVTQAFAEAHPEIPVVRDPWGLLQVKRGTDE